MSTGRCKKINYETVTYFQHHEQHPESHLAVLRLSLRAEENGQAGRRLRASLAEVITPGLCQGNHQGKWQG